MKKIVGIIGVGEVGSAIKKLAKSHFKVYSRDLNFDELQDQKVDTLHLCFPYSRKFVPIAIAAIKELKPKLVIINSTVKPGTTRIIYQSAKIPIAHVPIMGIHPNLDKYQKVFTKAIGAINDKSYRLARAHWKILGSKKITRFKGPEETELAKILSTTYYGWNIVFNKMAKQISDNQKTDFNQVYTKFNQIYNAGYHQTKPNVNRPVLEFMPGKIGGHCVIPNAKILKNISQPPLIKWILEYNSALKDEK